MQQVHRNKKNSNGKYKQTPSKLAEKKDVENLNPIVVNTTNIQI
jgi:hypothetical protein